jgi:MoaA/NifB/PqqE/SkfB family radical SAM enzyme
MVQFIGGEPTVYEELPQAVRLAARMCYPAVQIVTNGLKLADRAYAASLARAGLNTAAVSLHGPSPAVHDAVVGVRGAYEKVTRAIANLLDLGVYVTTGTAVTGLNYRELPALAELAFGRFGLDSCHMIAAHYIGWAGKNRDRLRVPYSRIAPFVREAAAAPARYGRRPPFPFLSNFLPCVLPGYERVMGDWKLPERDDDLYLPGESHEGRMYTMITEKLRTKLPSCRGCVYGRVCAGFEKEHHAIYGGGEFKPLKRRPAPLAPAPLLK